MVYNISDFAKQKAKKLGVEIKPSKTKNKKIDVFKKGEKIASVGDTRYFDYRSYIDEKGQAYADTRRRLYKIRHERNRNKVDTPAYFADQLLW